MKEYIKGANPYMPLWEHVPDGEPRVFEHNGEKEFIFTVHTIRKRHSTAVLTRLFGAHLLTT